jgi:type I restriction enzyme S subunit
MISGKMYRFRTLTDRIEPRYLESFLQTQDAQASIDNMKTGTSDSGLNLTHDRFRGLMVPVAPRKDQDRIVEKIEQQLSRLEAGVAALKRVQSNLQRYRAAVLKAACEGRLVPTEAELSRHEGRSYEPAAALLTGILAQREQRSQQQRRRGGSTPPARYRQPRPPDATSLPEVPEGWAWASAEQLTDETRAITYGVIKLGDPVDGGVPVLRSSDVRKLRLSVDTVKRISPAIADRYRRTCLQGSEVLVTVRGTLGGVAIVPPEYAGYNISREVAMLALVEREMARAVAILIASRPVEDWLLRRTRGIAYTGINIETLKALPIPMPPLAEQHRIVAEVERRLTLADDLHCIVSTNLHRAKRLRQSVLSAAFAGKLRDPSVPTPAVENLSPHD